MIFPGFVYKSPGRMGKVRKKTYDWCAVQDEQELAQKLSEGWYATRDEAFNPRTVNPKIESVTIVAEPVEVEENAPPTRAELEQKARELGLKFDGRTSDRKLLKMIEES
jgi:hypothetical protein